jgi:retron-type reverse transcriptase
MEISKIHIEKIKFAFEKMQTKDDLLELLNYVKPLVYGEKSQPFELRQLTWHANSEVNKKRYYEFTVSKKTGGTRTINAPNSGLKSIQKTLAYVFQCVFEPHKAAHGFVRNKSIVDNAKQHIGQNYVYNIDLKDFFSSIDQARVWKCFQLRPFNLSKESSTPLEFMPLDIFLSMFFPGKTELVFKDLDDMFDSLLKKKNLEPTSTIKSEDALNFYKLNERYSCETSFGVIYTSKSYVSDKLGFVVLGNNKMKTKNGKSLEKSMWLVNKVPDNGRLQLASLLAALCCTELDVERESINGNWEKVKKRVLPQGAPTSPIITNIICQRLDFYLTAVAKRFNLKYSRYADDITFSSMHNVYQPESDFLKELHRIIADQNFHIKESKTRLQKDGYRKEVTGLLVNEKVNVQQRYIKQLRMWLYYWERYGYEKASGFFLQQYIADKGHVKKNKPDMANVIGGKLDYLKMVKGADNELYLKLKCRFDEIDGSKDPINRVLDAWETDGIEKSMGLFYLNNSA